MAAFKSEITPESLKRALAMPGRSQTELAAHLNVDASAVNRMVNGKRHIRADELGKIQAYLASTSQLSAFDAQSEDPGAKAALALLLTLNPETKLEGIVAHWTLQIVKALVDAYRAKIAVEDNDQARAFFAFIEAHWDVLLDLALGSNVVAIDAGRSIRNLVVMAHVLTSPGKADPLRNPTFVDALVAYIGPIEDLAMADICSKVNAYSAALALVISSGTAKAIESLQEAVRALERGILTGA